MLPPELTALRAADEEESRALDSALLDAHTLAEHNDALESACAIIDAKMSEFCFANRRGGFGGNSSS
jgi:hypothetical protein